MINNAKRGKISPNQLFFIFFVSRLVVSLTYIQAVTVGKFDSDVPIAFALSLLLTFVLSIPAVLCVKRKKLPLSNPVIGVLYLAFFLFFSSLTVSRFSYFATTKMNPESPMIIFAVLAFIAVCYGVYLGLEPLGRFASFCGALLVATIVFVLLFNIKNFSSVNFYPMFQNGFEHIAMNTVLFTCNSIEPVLLLSLSDKTNGDSVKPYFFGISCAYLGVFLLLVFCCGVLGDSADLQSFPIFTLFQTASINDMSRLDIFHTSFWIFAVFLKTAVLLYCASTLFQKGSHKSKVLILSAVAFLCTAFMNEILGTKMAEISKIVTVVMFVLFSFVFPCFALIFGRSDDVEKDN